MDKRQELIKRLRDIKYRVGVMCSEGHPPRMSIPARPDVDDDIVISQTCNDAIAMLESDSRTLAEGMMMAANLFDGIEGDYHAWEVCDIIGTAAAALTAKEEQQ
jgi:hypothetical protein